MQSAQILGLSALRMLGSRAQLGMLGYAQRSFTSASSDGLSWAAQVAHQAGLDKELTEKVVTVFTPSDEALEAFATANPSAAAGIVTGSSSNLAITAHVIPGKALSLEELKQGGPFTSEAGTTLTVCNNDGVMQVTTGFKSANIVKGDIRTGKGVIHIIDNVLTPSATGHT